MKKICSALFFFAFTCLNLQAATSPVEDTIEMRSLVCRNDKRMVGGSLQEVILMREESGYTLTSSVMGLRATTVNSTVMAEGMDCRMDDSMVSLCSNPEGMTLSVRAVKEYFFPSMDAKKQSNTTMRFTIMGTDGSMETMMFDAGMCEMVMPVMP